jgi:hypothetical protein
VVRRKSFEGIPRGDENLALLVSRADGRSSLAEIGAETGRDLGELARALHNGIRRGLLSHDLMPAATAIDPTRWLAARLAGELPAEPPNTDTPRARVHATVRLLDRYPALDAAGKVAAQAELETLVRSEARSPGEPSLPKADGASPAVRGRGRFYNDRVVVHEAVVGALDLTIGGGLAHDLQERVPTVLDALAHVAVRTKRRTNELLARTLGRGRFPFLRAIHLAGDLAVVHDPWLTDLVARALAECGSTADLEQVDLAGFVPDRLAIDLPVMCSVDILVPTPDLASYQAGLTTLVLGDIHDAPLLTPWALQFHPNAERVLAERDEQILRVLGDRRAVSVVARRSTGLPPLRFPGPVVELGPVDGPGTRFTLDQIYVHSDGQKAILTATGVDGELFLHNGELDTAVHTAFALPRVRPLVLPDIDHVPRLRWGNVVLARRRWRLHPGVLTEAPSRPAMMGDWLSVRRYLRRGGVPERFFAKANHERKPIFVDSASPLLLEGLLRLAKGADRLYASEVLPDQGGLWLQDGAEGFTAELRCVYLRHADDPDDDPAGTSVRTPASAPANRPRNMGGQP